MKTFICTAFLGFAVLSFSTARAQNVKLLMTGLFRGNEVTAKTGEVWYGLFPDSTGSYEKTLTAGFETARTRGYELARTRIIVDTVFDDLENDSTGKKVSTERSEKPLFLVKGLHLKERKDVKCFFKGNNIIFPGMDLSFGLGSRYCTLQATGTVLKESPRQESFFRNYQVYLFCGGKRQEIISRPEFDVDDSPRLIWIGDLDEDNAPDFLFDLKNRYSFRLYTLFLSSFAGEGEMVAKVAEFKTIID